MSVYGNRCDWTHSSFNLIFVLKFLSLPLLLSLLRNTHRFLLTLYMRSHLWFYLTCSNLRHNVQFFSLCQIVRIAVRNKTLWSIAQFIRNSNQPNWMIEPIHPISYLATHQFDHYRNHTNFVTVFSRNSYRSNIQLLFIASFQKNAWQNLMIYFIYCYCYCYYYFWNLIQSMWLREHHLIPFGIFHSVLLCAVNQYIFGNYIESNVVI